MSKPNLVADKTRSHKDKVTLPKWSDLTIGSRPDSSAKFAEGSDQGPYFSMEMKMYDDSEDGKPYRRYIASYSCISKGDVINEWTKKGLELDKSLTAEMIMNQVIEDLAWLFSKDHSLKDK